MRKLKLFLKRIPLNAGGYEYGKWGKYFGVGQPLYYYESDSDEDISGHIRANDRDHAKAKLVARYSCRFQGFAAFDQVGFTR